MMARQNGASPARWTTDTELAFLLALRLLGSFTAACAAIGRSMGATQKRRVRLPAFEARCRASLDEHRRDAAVARARTDRDNGADLEDGDDEGGAMMNNRVRFDGWTPVRQRAFLRALSRTGGYSEACRAVGLSRTSLDRMRVTYPAFAAACERALGQSLATLEQVAYERAVEGWDEPIVHAGQIVGQRRRYSDSLMRLMLQRETARDGARDAARAGVAGPTAAAAVEPGDRSVPVKVGRGLYRRPAMTTADVDALLTRKLDALDRVQAKAERARMLAWADEMVRRGLAP